MDDRDRRLAEMIAAVSSEGQSVERLLARLDELMLCHETRQSVWFDVIGRLCEVCIECIENEENIMRAIRYSLVRDHCNDHQIVLDALALSIAECETLGKRGNIMTSLGNLKDMLCRHVASHDVPLLNFMRQENIANSLKSEASKMLRSSRISLKRHSSIIGIWDKGWDGGASAEINMGDVLARIGTACRANESVPEDARNDFAEDVQTAILELAFNNIVRNGLPFKNSASLITAVSGHGLLIRTCNLAYYRDYCRLADRVKRAKRQKNHQINFENAVKGGIEALNQKLCPSFGVGLDLILSMTKDSGEGCPHISVRKFPIPKHLRAVVGAFDYPEDIKPDDRVIVGVKVLVLIPYRRYVSGPRHHDQACCG